MIYFMQSVDGGPIKIGSSEDVDRRRRQLEMDYGRHLIVLSVIPGDRRTEILIHEKFAHLRFERTEQFRPGADLLDYIGRNRTIEPEKPVTKPLPSRKPDHIKVKLGRRLAARAKYTAFTKGIGFESYVESILLPRVNEEWERDVVAKLLAEEETSNEEEAE